LNAPLFELFNTINLWLWFIKSSSF